MVNSDVREVEISEVDIATGHDAVVAHQEAQVIPVSGDRQGRQLCIWLFMFLVVLLSRILQLVHELKCVLRLRHVEGALATVVVNIEWEEHALDGDLAGQGEDIRHGQHCYYACQQVLQEVGLDERLVGRADWEATSQLPGKVLQDPEGNAQQQGQAVQPSELLLLPLLVTLDLTEDVHNLRVAVGVSLRVQRQRLNLPL